MDSLSEMINGGGWLTLGFKKKLPKDRDRWLKTMVTFTNVPEELWRWASTIPEGLSVTPG